MDNYPNPVENGYEPIPVQPENIPSPGAVPDKKELSPRGKAAKRVFSRVGLAALLLFLVMQVIGSVVAVGAALPGMVTGMLEKDPTEWMSSPEAYISGIMETVESVLRSDAFFIGSVIGTALGLIAAVLIEKLVLKKLRIPPIEKKKLSAKEYFFMLFCALGFWGVGAIIGNLPGLCGLASPLDMAFPTEGLPGLIMTLYGILGAPILEEIACRKLLLDKAHLFGEVPAAFLTAVIFGLFHSNSTQFVLAMLVGLIFATVYLKTGNILYSMSFHLIINTIGSLSELIRYSTGITEIAGIDLGTWTFVLIGVLAVVGMTVAIIGRKSPLLALKRPDYPDAHRVITKNFGFIAFSVLTWSAILTLDVEAFAMNVFSAGAISLLCFVPTAVTAAIYIVFLCTVGKHTVPAQEIPVAQAPEQ